MKKYSEHYVAFLDILGFTALLTKNTCNQIFPIFKELHRKSSSSQKINGIQVGAYADIHHMILSDSIIVFIRADIDDAFSALIDVCGKLQRSLANRKNPILLRGGIAKGNLFYEDEIIYGPGLTNAYLLENKRAKFPRIIFTGDTLAQADKNTKIMPPLLEGANPLFRRDLDDMLYFVNFLPCFASMPVREDAMSYSVRLINLCDSWLNKEIDSDLREKYLWLKRNVGSAMVLWTDAKV